MASKMFMLLAVLVAVLVVIEARPGGKKGLPAGLSGLPAGGLPPRTINMPVMPAGTYGPMPPYPGAAADDYDDDSLESLASDPFGTVGKLLGGGGGGGMKKLLIIG